MNLTSKQPQLKNQINIIFAGLVLLFVALACGGSKTPPPSQYVGLWTGEDGTLITIRGDGSGDYKSGGSSVSGGTVTIDEAAKTLKISFAAMGPTYKIDMPPSEGRMTLGGVVFKKGDGSAPSSSTSDSSSAAGQIPSDDKLQSIVKTTLLDFNDAVQSGNFTSFHEKLAGPFAEQKTPEELEDVFRQFLDNKSNFNFSGIRNMKAAFSPAPSIKKSGDYDVLSLEGSYPTTPNKTKFTLEYIEEDSEWKLVSIRINTKEQ